MLMAAACRSSQNLQTECRTHGSSVFSSFKVGVLLLDTLADKVPERKEMLREL